MTSALTSGDDWPGHYRGYRLQTNPDGEVWWQAYQGSDRLYLSPTPDELVENVLSVKRLGGRVRVTEDNQSIARIENDDTYDDVYLGELDVAGELVPEDADEYAVDVQPTGLSAGDLWPSVYDGSKFSFGGDRIWWQNPRTHKRHPVEDDLSTDVHSKLQRLKPRGGSFRVTPWNDVVTLVEDPPNAEEVRSQLHDLPRVIKNIILLRRERGVEMLPIYVGSIDDVPLDISEPKSLTDELSPEERAKLDSWAGSLGATSETETDEHRVQGRSDDVPTDDPEDW